MDDSSRYIAVFGDVHGHIRLLFQLARLWQMQHGRHLEGILQCGDLGFFPESGKLDEATSRFSTEDPEELGFARFFRWPEPLEKDERLEEWLFGPGDSVETVRVPVVWCHGNHEDFLELAAAAGGADCAAVDTFGRLLYLRSGSTTDVAGVTVGALGGGPARGRDRHFHQVSGHGPDHEAAWRGLHQKACDQLVANSDRLDILISHAGPRSDDGVMSRSGSDILRWVLESSRPRYHFFAHHRGPVDSFRIADTQCFWLNDVSFEHRGTDSYGALHTGCMGILRWRNADDHEFAVVDEDWLRTMDHGNWRHR